MKKRKNLIWISLALLLIITGLSGHHFLKVYEKELTLKQDNKVLFNTKGNLLEAENSLNFDEHVRTQDYDNGSFYLSDAPGISEKHKTIHLPMQLDYKPNPSIVAEDFLLDLNALRTANHLAPIILAVAGSNPNILANQKDLKLISDAGFGYMTLEINPISDFATSRHIYSDLELAQAILYDYFYNYGNENDYHDLYELLYSGPFIGINLDNFMLVIQGNESLWAKNYTVPPKIIPLQATEFIYYNADKIKPDQAKVFKYKLKLSQVENSVKNDKEKLQQAKCQI